MWLGHILEGPFASDCSRAGVGRRMIFMVLSCGHRPRAPELIDVVQPVGERWTGAAAAAHLGRKRATELAIGSQKP
jgi:hypothetical protein